MARRRSRSAVAEDLEQGSWEPTDLGWWMIQRQRIKQLYLVDRLTREQTRFVMNDLYQFNASDRQYRYLIEKKWQLQKTLTYEDKKFVILKTLQRYRRDGLPTKFLLCGREIDNGKLSRQRNAIIAAETHDRDLGPAPRNLMYYTPPDAPLDTPSLRNPASQTLSTGKGRSWFTDKLFCITCILCEHDIYGFGNAILADFERHLDNEHVKSQPVTNALVSCSHKPEALADCRTHDRVVEWDVDEDKDVFRNLNSLPSVGSLSSINVIQHDSLWMLWLVNDSEPNNLTSLGILTKSSDPTPVSFFSNLRIQPSSRADQNFAETVVTAGTDKMSSTILSQDKDRGNLKRGATLDASSNVDGPFVKRYRNQQAACIASVGSTDDLADEVNADQMDNATNLVPKSQRLPIETMDPRSGYDSFPYLIPEDDLSFSGTTSELQVTLTASDRSRFQSYSSPSSPGYTQPPSYGSENSTNPGLHRLLQDLDVFTRSLQRQWTFPVSAFGLPSGVRPAVGLPSLSLREQCELEAAAHALLNAACSPYKEDLHTLSSEEPTP